jgi:magnesium transporter
VFWHHSGVDGHLILTDGTMITPTSDAIARAVKDDQVSWLDLHDSGPRTAGVLRDVFGFHPLAVEDALEFGQRPKIEVYDDFTFLVAYGAPAGDATAGSGAASSAGVPAPRGAQLQEVHCFFSERSLVTVHHGDVAAVTAVCEAVQRRPGGHPPALLALYRVLDGLTDSMFPYLAAFDDRIDDIQVRIFTRPGEKDLAAMFTMKRELVDIRRVVTPQRDMMTALIAGRIELPGTTRDMEHYFRDLYDHLIRISDLVDSYRDLLSGTMDAYLSMTNNRLNGVMKQLTIIATVFLPLSFLTGFFGQNFEWMTDRVTTFGDFAGYGLGTEAVAVTLLFLLFWRRGWLRGEA